MCSYSYCLPVVEKVFKSFNGKLYLHYRMQNYSDESYRPSFRMLLEKYWHWRSIGDCLFIVL